MNEALAKLLDASAQSYPEHSTGEKLKASEHRFERHPWWRVLESEDDDRLALGQIRLQEFQAVAEGAGVSRVWVKHVLRPVLCGSAVVTERADNLELHCPLVWYEKIGEPLGGRKSIGLRLRLTQPSERGTDGISLAKRTDTRLKLLVDSMCGIDGRQRIRKVSDQLRKRECHKFVIA